jgi:tetratricopeptide (TPR) repeat protein
MGFFGLFKSQKEKEAHDMMMRGMYLYSGRMYNQAIFFCDRALEFDPVLVPALHIKGSAMGEYGHCEIALTILDQALHLDPDFAPSWMMKGLLLCEMKRFSEAIPCFNNVIEAGPYYYSRWQGFTIGPQSKKRYADALYARALAYFEVGDYSKAEAGYNEALEFDPKNPLAQDLKQKMNKSKVV